MGVFCLDRTGTPAFGTASRVWELARQVLLALRGELVEQAWTVDGYVPSWLARSWGDLLFRDLGTAVVVCRPVTGRPTDLTPVGVYRQGTPPTAGWARTGEQLSVYDTPLASVLLRLAQVLSGGDGLVVTTLRPPAPGSARSDVAVRSLLRRSGMLAAPQRPRPGRTS